MTTLLLNPSLAVQNGLVMIGALSFVEFLREIPLYLAGEEPSKKTITVKFMIALAVISIVLIIMITYAHDAHVQHVQPGSGAVPV